MLGEMKYALDLQRIYSIWIQIRKSAESIVILMLPALTALEIKSSASKQKKSN